MGNSRLHDCRFSEMRVFSLSHSISLLSLSLHTAYVNDVSEKEQRKGSALIQPDKESIVQQASVMPDFAKQVASEHKVSDGGVFFFAFVLVDFFLLTFNHIHSPTHKQEARDAEYFAK
jgi:hypothetical protein